MRRLNSPRIPAGGDRTADAQASASPVTSPRAPSRTRRTAGTPVEAPAPVASDPDEKGLHARTSTTAAAQTAASGAFRPMAKSLPPSSINGGRIVSISNSLGGKMTPRAIRADNTPRADPPCPVMRAPGLIGVRRSLLTVRDAMDGARASTALRQHTGIARSTPGDGFRRPVGPWRLDRRSTIRGRRPPHTPIRPHTTCPPPPSPSADGAHAAPRPPTGPAPHPPTNAVFRFRGSIRSAHAAHPPTSAPLPFTQNRPHPSPARAARAAGAAVTAAVTRQRTTARPRVSTRRPSAACPAGSRAVDALAQAGPPEPEAIRRRPAGGEPRCASGGPEG